jgi:tetratricopeptide (TPR) repeat protein
MPDPGSLTALMRSAAQQDFSLPRPADPTDTAVAAATATAKAHYTCGISLQQQRNYDQALAAFDAAIALNPAYAEAHNSRGTVLANLDRHRDALKSFNKAIALKPDYAACHNNLGIVLQELTLSEEALVSFDRAIALQKDNARAHNNRGAVLNDMNRTSDALISFDKAIALDPSYAEAFYNRGLALHDAKRFDDALVSLDQAISLRPEYAKAHHNRGAVLQDLRRTEEAIVAYDSAIALQPDRAESSINQAYCYLQMGRFEVGWSLHEWRKKLPVPVGDRSLPRPLWLGREEISGKTLFVHWEQGLGDTIQFCRYVKLLRARGADVLMSVQEPLYRLLTQMTPEIGLIRQNETPTKFDFHCPMMSLPLALGTTLTTIPAERRYIFSDHNLRSSWEARLPAKTRLRIGVVRRGSATHKNDRYRSIDAEALASLSSADVQWIALSHDSEQPDKVSPGLRQHFSCAGALQDFADTAAVIDCLDLVITVDTSVAHLSGAIGKPVWILLPFNSDWRWLLDRTDSPWYPSARLFRQDHGESWRDVILRVRSELARFVQLHS